ncbi:hypothetical protein D9M69_606050 [compost metagenome]
MICLRVRVSSGSGGEFLSVVGGRGGSGAVPGRPPICTGEAAPRLVPGVMAAMWLAYRI